MLESFEILATSLSVIILIDQRNCICSDLYLSKFYIILLQNCSFRARVFNAMNPISHLAIQIWCVNDVSVIKQRKDEHLGNEELLWKEENIVERV